MDNELLKNIDKIHTTPMGIDRIKKNLNISCDPVSYSIDIIKNNEAMINRVGKNYYISYHNIVITVNAFSYTIITAHKE